MKKIFFSVTLIAFSILISSYTSNEDIPDTDPIYYFDGTVQVTVNDVPIYQPGIYIYPFEISICPGKGEKCEFKFGYGSYKIKIKEEKDPDKDILEIKKKW